MPPLVFNGRRPTLSAAAVHCPEGLPIVCNNAGSEPKPGARILASNCGYGPTEVLVVVTTPPERLSVDGASLNV
jgi:hypothetical protein